MADLFDTAGVHRSDRGAEAALWIRRALVALFVVAVVAASLGAIGQESATSQVAAPAATLTVNAPELLRGGLYWQARVEVRARRTIDEPRLVLGRGWFEAMQVSSIKPEPAEESSEDGRVGLTYDRLDAGDRLVVWLQFQVDPTLPGRRDAPLELFDGAQRIAQVSRTITVLF